MKIALVLAGLLSIAAIVGSAASVITRTDQPLLALSVEGVPGYVYYNRDYALTIDYANRGGAYHGPVHLTAEFPDSFSMAAFVGNSFEEGRKLEWTLEGLDAGESGTLPLTVRGTLPRDLTNAVYDIPGYEGHTAFVDGFNLTLTLTAGTAVTRVSQVTPAGQDAPIFTKGFNPDTISEGGVSTLTFTIDNSPDRSTLVDSLSFTDALPLGLVIATPGNASTTCTGGTLTADDGGTSITYSGGSVAGNSMCTVQVDVTASSADQYDNTSGDLTSSYGNSGPATATLTVEAPAAHLEVRKLVLGFFDSGRFDLKIDGNTYATAVRSGGSTGAVEVPGGPHTVSEAGAGATSLGNYHSTVLCYQRGGGFVGYGFSPSLTVNVSPGQDVVCTIVNQRSFSWFWWR